MDVFQAVASKRDERRYAAGQDLAPDLVERILDAGRLAGSARNRQPWRFVVVESAPAQEALARAVFVPENVTTAALIVAVVTPGGKGALDVGRAAQNMMLTAWDEGVLSTLNGFADAERASAALGLSAELQPLIVISFGYPARSRNPAARSAQEWSQRADRKALVEVVERR
ncbi:MAG: nitroreductase family protein [Actinomycetia bacterium]|nr:nitroreductase family protein [Actinomycetes bacterium]